MGLRLTYTCLCLSLVISNCPAFEFDWEYPIKFPSSISAHIEKDTVFLHQCCTKLNAINIENGTSRWHRSVEGGIVSVLANSIVVQNDQEHYSIVTVLYKDTGKTRAQWRIPLIQHGWKFIGTDTYAVRVGYIENHPILLQLNLKTGKVIEKRSIQNNFEKIAIVNHNAYYIDYNSNLDPGKESPVYVFKMDLSKGVMQKNQLNFDFDKALLPDNCIFRSGEFMCINLASATTSWKSKLRTLPHANYRYEISDAYVYVIQNAWIETEPGQWTKHPNKGTIFALSKHDGQMMWKYDMGEIQEMSLGSGYVALTNSRSIHVLENRNGRLNWKKTKKIASRLACPVIAYGKIWVGETNRFSVYDIQSGKKLSSQKLPKIRDVCPLLADNKILINGVVAIRVY